MTLLFHPVTHWDKKRTSMLALFLERLQEFRAEAPHTLVPAASVLIRRRSSLPEPSVGRAPIRRMSALLGCHSLGSGLVARAAARAEGSASPV